MKADERAALMAAIRGVPGESREAIRQALLELRREGRPVTVRAVRDLAHAKRDHVGDVVRAYREDLLDLALSWERLDVLTAPATIPPAAAAASPSPAAAPDLPQLLSLIDNATSPSGLAAVANTVSRLVAAAALDVAAGRLVLDACREQRQALSDARATEPPPEDPHKLRLASPQAMDAAAALDRIVDDDRFDRVLAYIADELEADMIQWPNTDQGGA